MFHFRYLTIVLVALSVSGCWKPSKKDDPNFGESDAAATFRVKDAGGDSITPRDTHSAWRVPVEKEFAFWICVQDRAASETVKGHVFSVEIPERKQTIRDLKTDNEGCFKWTESVPYNYFAYRPWNVAVTRTVRGQGVHTGARKIRFAINPWADERKTAKADARSVIYLGGRQGVSASQLVDESQARSALEGKLENEKAQLWIRGLSMQVTQGGRMATPSSSGEAKGGTPLEVRFRMEPVLLVENLSGQRVPIRLERGSFTVWAHLVGDSMETQGQKVLLTPYAIPSTAKITAGDLEGSVKVSMSRWIPRGRLELALKIVANDAPGGSESIKEFAGVYLAGTLDKIEGTSRPFIDPDVSEKEGAFDFAAYLKSADNFESLKKDSLAFDIEPFYFEQADTRFAGIKPGETATTRTIEYAVITCVRERLTGARVPLTKFSVYDEKGAKLVGRNKDGEPVPTMTNQDGCLTWPAAMTHKYYKAEEYFFPSFTIKHEATGFTKVKHLVVNPWDAMFRTFGWDRSYFSEDLAIRIKGREKIPSRFFVPRYSYHTIRFRYAIDEYMSLEVKKQILLNLKPEVLRYSGIIGGRKVTEALRDGVYLMKVAIDKEFLDPADRGNRIFPIRVKDPKNGNETISTGFDHMPDLKKKHFITVVQKLVRVNAGEVNTTVEFSMQDLRLMRVRSQFHVQLETIDERLLQAANVLTKELVENRDFRANVSELKIDELKEKPRSDSGEQVTERQLTKEYVVEEHKNPAVIARRKRVELALSELKAALASNKEGDLNTFNINIKPEVRKKIMDTLQINDFTVTDVAPIVDLNVLLEANSGLEKRTFVGPVIFLSNAYSDDLRPTDLLDEAKCIQTDCDQIKAELALMHEEQRPFSADKINYEESRYFGSVKHFYGEHVDALIKKYLEQKEYYRQSMPVLASIYNFVALNNLEYVPLDDRQALLKYDESCKHQDPRLCMAPTKEYRVPVTTLLHGMNHPSPEMDGYRRSMLGDILPRAGRETSEVLRPVTRSDLNDVIYKGKLSSSLVEGLCRRTYGNLVANIRPGLQWNLRKDVYLNCLRIAARGGNPYALDYKVRVLKTGDYIFNGGKQMNINVASNFSLNHSQSFSYGAGVNFAELPAIGKLMSAANSALEKTVGNVGTMFKPLSLRIGYDTSHSRSDGTTVSESTYLVMQSASFEIDIVKYERCVVLKPNHNFMRQFGGQFMAILRDEEADNFARAMHQGFFICSGAEDKKPVRVAESYFYFTQHFTEGDMLDQADLYNHPWLLALRGQRDFQTFMRLMRDREYSIFTLEPVVEKPGWALDKMVDTYRNILPTFPGLYTVIGPTEGLKEFPFHHDPRILLAPEPAKE